MSHINGLHCRHERLWAGLQSVRDCKDSVGVNRGSDLPHEGPFRFGCESVSCLASRQLGFGKDYKVRP